MAIIKLTKDNYDEIINTSKTVLVDFYADWCNPCRMLSPVIDQIAEEHDEYVVAKVDVDRESELAIQFGVASIPTLVVIKNGKETNRAMGVRPKSAVLALLEE